MRLFYWLHLRSKPLFFLYVLLQVKAVHDYAATDGDELELKTGDVVLALSYDNPDEQVIYTHFLLLLVCLIISSMFTRAFTIGFFF